MTRDEFVKEYTEVEKLALQCLKKVWTESFLTLEKELDQEKINERDIFHFGLRLVLDRTDKKIIEKILSNIVRQEKDKYMAILRNTQKAAVFSIQEGSNPVMLCSTLNSYTDMTIEEDKVLKKTLEEEKILRKQMEEQEMLYG